MTPSEAREVARRLTADEHRMLLDPGAHLTKTGLLVRAALEEMEKQG